MNKNLNKLSKPELLKELSKVMSKVDGWSNLFTGLNKQNSDKRTGGLFVKDIRLQREELTNLYVYDGISKRVIDIKIEDMLRNKYIVTNDTDDLLIKAAKDLKFIKQLKEAITWQDVYGGSLIIMGINDGQEFEDPLNENNIKSIDFLKVYDRHQISIDSSRLYEDPKEKKYGEPEIYNISPDGGGMPFDVHETRVLRFDGAILPDCQRIENEYWGDSVYQSYYQRLKGIGNTYINIETIIEEFIIGVLHIENLPNLLQSGQGSDVLNRLNYIDMSKHIINSILLDKEEIFERISATVSGIDELITKLESSLSAVTGIPVTRLYGQSPKGLNASGQENAQIKQYYDMIEAKNEDDILDQIERFNYLLMLSKNGPTKGVYYDDWKVEFPPLYTPTEKETAEIKKLNAETSKIEIESGILFPGEVANCRYAGIEYNNDIKISDSHIKMIESEEKVITEAAKNGVFSIQSEEDRNKKKEEDINNKEKGE